jgi:hypothetical protein
VLVSLLVGIALLTLLDAVWTKRQMRRYGPRVELNPLVRRFGIAAILIPSGSLLVLLALWGNMIAASIIFSIRLLLGAAQLRSIHVAHT